MDDKKINALLTAVGAGSLSKAAQELGYTQSGLTQMMNGLEDELGCPILIRGYNGVRLTPVGEQLLPFFEDAANSLRRLRDEAINFKAGAENPIRIGVFPSLSKSWLPYVLAEFKKKSPGTSVEITVGGYDIPKWLDKDEIDLALVEESMRGANRWIPLCQDNYRAVVSIENPLAQKDVVTIDELVNYPFIMSNISELKIQLKPYTHGRIRDGIQMNSVDDAAILSLVERGLGVTILPELSLLGCSDKLKIIDISPPLTRTLGIAMPRSARRQINEFVEFIKNLDSLPGKRPE